MKFLYLSFLLLLPQLLYSEAVCDERLLILELKQDLEDNGVLDCLRVIQPPHSYSETIEEKNKRIAAQWDTSCAFEADYDWMKPLREIHGISNLVDDTGDMVDRDFPDQADMCEIIRAAIASGKFNKITTELTNIPLKILDLIDCPGSADQSEICAVTGSSYFQNDTWYILLDGLALSIDNKPHFVIAPNEPSLPDIPEVQRELLKNVESSIGGSDSITDFKKNLRSKKDKLAGQYEKIKGLISNMNTEEGMQTIIIPPSEKTLIIENDPKKSAQTVSANKWNPFGNAILKIGANEEKIALVITSSTINFERDRPSHFLTKLLLDGEEQKDARTIQGNAIVGSLNTAFLTKLKGDHKVHLEYRTPGTLTSSANNPEAVWQDNRYISALLLHQNLKFKRVKKENSINLAKSTTWVPCTDASLKFTIDIDRPVLFFYNLAFGSTDNVATRLSIDGQALSSSYKTIHSNAYAGLFGMGTKILSSGNEHQLNLEYIANSNRNINVGSDDWNSFGLSMLELPITSVIHEKTLDSSFSLSVGEWNLLGNLKFELKMDREKNCLIFYSVNSNMPTNNLGVYTRITDNSKEIISSRAASSNGNEFGISSQLFANFKTGKHNIQLEFFTQEKDVKIDPVQDLQKASLTIIEFEAGNQN